MLPLSVSLQLIVALTVPLFVYDPGAPLILAVGAVFGQAGVTVADVEVDTFESASLVFPYRVYELPQETVSVHEPDLYVYVPPEVVA